MRVRNVDSQRGEKIEVPMTPMIDIVFQLLVFFIMTFKIVALEGDFNIKMPLAAPREGEPEERDLPPWRLRLEADSNGTLDKVLLDGKSFGSSISNTTQVKAAFEAVNQEIIARLGDERGPGSIADTAEVELDCDYNLDYEFVIGAVTAVSGYVSDDGKTVVKLVEKIKFAPPRGGPAE